MSNIFGTIISIGDFLKKENAEVKIIRADGTEHPFILTRERRYVIPDYQREIRWSKENLIELVNDLSKREKFLGNIILNKRPDSKYEVIDGQQRITVLLMVIYFIKSKFGQALDILETCDLEMANFDRFDILIENKFEISNLTEELRQDLECSDVFNQRKRYQELWSEFEKIDKLRTAADCASFLTNLKRSQVNLIANTNDIDNSSIDYFLDVNLKGVKLDTEDIFKGYLFSLDSGQIIRDEWKNFKVLAFKLNQKTEYPITKLIEHFLYCDLYKEETYRNIQFGEDFLIKEAIISDEKHYSGEHIVKVIRNNAYMISCLRKINGFLRTSGSILNSETPSQEFKDLFNVEAHMDQAEITIIYNFIRKVLKDRNVVPRILVMKYILEILLDTNNKTKEDYRKIYGVYLLAIVFTIFEGEKDVKKVLGIVKDSNWHTKSIEQAKSYFSRDNIPTSRITAQYKLLAGEDETNYMYRCKSLATIYNYFEINDQLVKIKDGKMEELKQYLSDRVTYEHFIINNSQTYKISVGNTSKNIKYPSTIRKKYANSIFNFIFIPGELNNDLDSYTLFDKLYIIDQKLEANPRLIECEYSKMVIEKCKSDFISEIEISINDLDQAEVDLNNYYDNQLIQQFNEFASNVIIAIKEKFLIN